MLVAAGLVLKPGGKIDFGLENPYTILRDSPEDFFALDERCGTAGFLQAIAMNGITGTLIEIGMYTSIPQGAHPESKSTFDVCSSIAS